MTDKDQQESHELEERRSLIRSAFGYLTFGLLGIVFAILTASNAILLDGIYSLVSFILALAALRVTRLIEFSGSSRFHFGFAQFEPILNMAKVGVILVIDIFAIFTATESLIYGGRELSSGIATIYGAATATLCILISRYQARTAERIGSPILKVDARGWFIDGMISSSVAFAFLVAFLIKDTSYSYAIPYIDPVLVYGVVLVTLPATLRSLRENFPQVFLAAPTESDHSQIEQIVAEGFTDLEHEKLIVRGLPLGRSLYVLVHVVLSKDCHSIETEAMDKAQRTILKNLLQLNSKTELDIVYTTDDKHLNYESEHKLPWPG